MPWRSAAGRRRYIPLSRAWGAAGLTGEDGAARCWSAPLDAPILRPMGGPNRGGAAMKIFLAGASGVIGRLLVPLLVAAGYEVVGTTRRADRLGEIAAAG